MMDRVAAITLAGVLGLSGLALAATLDMQDNADAPAAAPSPVPTSLPAISAAQWDGLPLTAGDWSWRSFDGGPGETLANFHTEDGEHLVSLGCEPDNRQLALAVANSSRDSDAITVHTETQSRELAADAREGWIATVIYPEDELLDAMAFSRGRIGLVIEGELALSVPAYPEITRVIEDCR